MSKRTPKVKIHGIGKLDKHYAMKQTEIGKELGMTKQHVYMTQQRALKKMKKYLLENVCEEWEIHKWLSEQ